MNYHSNINKHLINIIPPSCSNILEIGCGSAPLALPLKKRNPKLIYTGIEINAEALDKSPSLSFATLVNENIENLNINNIPNSPFDCIIFGDVLEHLVDPWSVLKSLSTLLLPNSFVAASIPNVAHCSIIASLLADQWNYTPNGLLDLTHLRFFTLNSITNLFSNASLSILEINASPLTPPNYSEFLSAAAPLLKYLAIPPFSFAQSSSVYQYTILASNKPPNPPPTPSNSFTY
jgi:SAM-dependent methyltransferase